MSDTVPHLEPHPEYAPDPCRHLGAFVIAVLSVGALRFGLTVSGTGDSLARWASMTAVILAGLVYFAWRAREWKQRLAISYVLIAPYMLVEAAGIGYQWATGNPTIFHAEPYSFGTEIHVHFWGHIVGGLTWEPWALFLMMSLLAGVIGIARGRPARRFRALC